MQVFISSRLLILSSFLCCIYASSVIAIDNPEDVYDQALAEKLGADDYGMRSYVLVILKTGPAKITDKAEYNKIFRGHFANMKRLAKQKKLVLAGPFMDAGDSRGLYIFNVETIAQAKKLVDTDPAVTAAVFVAEYKKYYGSAALMMVNDIHQRIQKIKIE